MQIREFIESGSFTDAFMNHIDACEQCLATVAQLCERIERQDGIQRGVESNIAKSLGQVDKEFLSRLAGSCADCQADRTCREDTLHDSVIRLETIRFPGSPTDIGPLGCIDSLHVISKIGSGGFGDVYLAFDEKFNREVALKVLRTSVSEPGYLVRFKREAQSAGSIRHENVVMHLGMFEPTANFPHACLILEYVSGGSLKQLMKSEQSIEVEQAVRWIIQAARGLAAVHGKGIIHRDIKPANLLLGEGRTIKLSDFGLARETSSTQDVSVQVAGTPPYMSPEQIQTPDQLSSQTDIYSLGVVLYEVLTGSRPFRGNDVALRRQIIHEQATPLRQLNPQVPLDLETICLRALHKEPSRRFPSANDFADDLQRWLDGLPISSRPIGRLEKAYLWTRRNPELACLCLLMFITSVISLGAALWIGRLRSSEAQARIAADQNAAEATKHRNISLDTMQMMVKDLGERIGTHEALIALFPNVTEQLEDMNSGASATPKSQHLLAISNLETAHIYLAFSLVLSSPEPLEKAKKHFERSAMLLESLSGDHRNDLVRVYDGLGSYHLRVGDLTAAQLTFQKTLEIGEELLLENPNDTNALRSIAVVHESLGKIKWNRGKVEGLEHYKTSLSQRERLVKLDASSPLFKSDLGSVLINYGMAIRPSEPETARSYYDRAVKLYSELVTVDPLNTTYLRGLALGYDQQGVELASAERMPYLTKALAIREEARRLEPSSIATLNGLIVSYIGVAQNTDDPVEARENFKLALELANSWAQKESQDPQPLNYIARVSLGFCTLQRKEMKLDEAKASAAEAIRVRRKMVAMSPIASNKSSLVVALAELAEIEQQLEEFESALKNLDEALACLSELKAAQELLPRNEAWIPELTAIREKVLTSLAERNKHGSPPSDTSIH